MRSSIFRRLAVVSAIALMALGATASMAARYDSTTSTLPTPNVTETFAWQHQHQQRGHLHLPDDRGPVNATLAPHPVSTSGQPAWARGMASTARWS